MKTDDLVIALSRDSAVLPSDTVARKLALALGVGLALSAAAMVLYFGVRPDLMPAMHTGPFWMKFAYALSVAVLGFGLIDRLARPDGEGGVFGAMIIAPLAVMLVLAVMQESSATPEQRMAMMLGSTYQVCARNIVLLSVPIFVGLFWALRSLAPTRLVLAGGVAGMLAGAAGTVVYAFHCTESAMPFVVIWYTLGIGAVSLVGALMGRVLLRW
jgi:hypothetical protein